MAILRGRGERFACHLGSNAGSTTDPGPLAVLPITRRLSGETGHQGSRAHLVSVRSEYASYPSRTAVVFCVFPPRPPLPHLGERGARCERLVAAGVERPCSRYKGQSIRHAPHHRWTGSFARASTSYSQCRAVSSTSTPLPSSTVRPTPFPCHLQLLVWAGVSRWACAAVDGTKPPSRKYSTLVSHKKRNQIDQDAPWLSPMARWARGRELLAEGSPTTPKA